MGFLLLTISGLFLVNLASAGVAALLAIKSSRTPRWRRAIWACLSTGVLIAIAAISLGIVAFPDRAVASSDMSFALAMIIAVSAAFSFPGAFALSRLAERPPPVGDTFD